MDKLTLGSLFDGSGGFTLGAVLTGVEPLWASEVEPFPIRVTTKRLPNVKHYGDINKINGAEVPPVDIITGGFCCQDLSVAGKRAGIHGERSGLFFQIIRIVKEMRAATNNTCPSFVVLENVPGMYSSAGGADYLEVLNALIKIKDETLSVSMPENGKWSTAGEIVGDGFSLGWRTFDAQFWGVAQRRRRCYIVLDLVGERAGKILFDESRLRGHPPQGCFAGQTTSGNPAAGTGGAVCVLSDQGGSYMDVSEDVTGTLRSQEHGHQPVVIQSAGFCPEQSAKTRGIGYEDEKSPTLRAGVVPGSVLSFEPGITARLGRKGNEEIAPTLRADMGDNQVAIALQNHPADSRVKIDESGTVQTLTERMGTGGGNVPMVCEPKTLKIRSGCEGGGKGALVQDNLSATLSCNNDQTVFVPKAYYLDKSGAREKFVAHTLNADSCHLSSRQGGTAVTILKLFGIDAQNSNSMKSGSPHSGIHEMDVSRTLDTGACSGNGGQVVVFDGKQVTSKENRSNPQPGDPCHTLASGSADSAVVAIEGNGTRPSHKGSGFSEDGIAYTLNSVEQHGVSYAMTTGCYTQVCEEQSPTLQARDYKDAPVVNMPQYIVRRLTPTECALLQGL